MAVAKCTWHSTYEQIIPKHVRNLALAQWYKESDIAERASRGNATFLVATTNCDEVIGYVQAGHRQEDGDAELFAIYVLPTHQGSGVGTAMLQNAVECLGKKRSISRLYVQVERDNHLGRAFYNKRGFQTVREYSLHLFEHHLPMVEMLLLV